MEKTKTYHCSACGKDDTLLLNDVIESGIARALREDDIEALKRYKSEYYNIEWMPPTEVHIDVNNSTPVQSSVENIKQEECNSGISVKQILRGRGYSNIIINREISRQDLEIVLLCLLELRGKVTVDDLLSEKELGRLVAQQANATLFGLCKQGKVIKTVEGGKPSFQLLYRSRTTKQ